MADSIPNEAPPPPQPNGSNDIQHGEPDAMAIVTSETHPDGDANGSSLGPADSTRVEKVADAPSGSQDVAPADGASTNANTTPTPGPVATTPAPAAISGAAGSPARAPTPVKADANSAAAAVSMPAEPAAHGAPTRVYLNTKVTQHVLEGMKVVALKKPEQPLRVLGEFLLQRSLEFETPAVASTTEEDKTPAADESMKDVEQ